MPSIAPKNYLTTYDEFAAHWAAVNAAINPDVSLTGNYGITAFNNGRTALADQITAAEVAINANEGAIAIRDNLRAKVKERMRQFNQFVRGAFYGSPYTNMLPKVPTITAAPGTWMKAMADMHNVWTQINAILPVPPGAPVPMILTGGYTLAMFTTDQAALNAAFTSIETTANAIETALDLRDVLWRDSRQRMKEYRLSVKGRFAKGEALLSSLPALTPAGGHTPNAVNVSAVWDAGISKAVITYTASADSQLQEYELRGSIGGTKYSNNNAVVLDNHAAGNVAPFETDQGLVVSGSKVFYKVYVVLKTGNVRGSATVSVARP